MRVWIARFARWLLAWAERPTPVADPIEAAVHAVCADLGLNAAFLSPSFDLSRSGKLPEILYHAALRLDRDHALTTVGDVVSALKGTR